MTANDKPRERHRFTREDAVRGGNASVAARTCRKCGRVLTANELREGHRCKAVKT